MRWKDVVKRDPCPYCLHKSETVEHVVPVARGGLKRNADNKVGACRTCNELKGSQGPLTFILARGVIGRRTKQEKFWRYRQIQAALARRKAI